MIFRFVAEYSQHSDLRREFASNPQAVLDRYEIPEAERQHLLSGDREKVACQLHAEIDEMLGGKYQAVFWPVYYPNILSHSMQKIGFRGEPIEIEIAALNLAPNVKVRFHRGALRVEATILQIDRSLQSRVDTIHCQVVFPETGTWDVEVLNLVEGEERSDVRKGSCTISFQAVHRLQPNVRAASEGWSGSSAPARLLSWPRRQAQALASRRAGRAPSDRIAVAAAA